MERKSAEMVSSFVTVIFSISAIIVYIAYGGLLSYVLIGIAIVIAIFNAWFISYEEREAHPHPLAQERIEAKEQAKPKRKVKRKAKSRGKG